MQPAVASKILAASVTLVGLSVLSGCFRRDRREPRHEDVVVVHGDHHDEHHEEEHHDEHR